MALKLDKTIEEAKHEAGLSLVKHAQAAGMQRMDLRSQMLAVFDISGSMADRYRNGTVAALAKRALAVALHLDDNGDIPVYLLGDDCVALDQHINDKNVDTYVKTFVQKHVGGGTMYSPTFRQIHDDLEIGDPGFCLFFTDGDCDTSDYRAAEDAIKRLSNNPVFIQFIGIHEGVEPSFAFLEKLNHMGGRKIDNAGFCTFDVKRSSDEELYDALLNEYPDFRKEAVRLGMIPWKKIVR
jgi:hypothetical protein